MSNKTEPQEQELRAMIKENLIKLRKANNLTQYEVADALCMPDSSTYRSWETGRSAPKISSLIKISKMYNVTVDEILGIKTDNSIPKNTLNACVEYNKKVYGSSYMSELKNSEKLVIMKYRQLNDNDKVKLSKYLENLIHEIDYI